MEEWMIYFGLAALIGIITLLVTLVSNKQSSEAVVEVAPQQQVRNVARQRPGNQRRVAAGNRRRVQNLGRDDSDSDGGRPANHSDQSDVDQDEKLLADSKLGAKKRAKLEAKAEKRSQREAEEKLREERKAREIKDDEERKKQNQLEAEEEKRQLEEEKRLREEKAQRDLEEYMKLKEAFTVEDEGCDAPETEDEGNLIEKFINHVKENKVILFEELATQFGLKVPEAIDRLTTLVAEGRLTGVMDDRGKFIYISEEELTKFSKFVKQRGRVSVADLVENSANLITLTPETKAVVEGV